MIANDTVCSAIWCIFAYDVTNVSECQIWSENIIWTCILDKYGLPSVSGRQYYQMFSRIHPIFTIIYSTFFDHVRSFPIFADIARSLPNSTLRLYFLTQLGLLFYSCTTYNKIQTLTKLVIFWSLEQLCIFLHCNCNCGEVFIKHLFAFNPILLISIQYWF